MDINARIKAQRLHLLIQLKQPDVPMDMDAAVEQAVQLARDCVDAGKYPDLETATREIGALLTAGRVTEAAGRYRAAG